MPKVSEMPYQRLVLRMLLFDLIKVGDVGLPPKSTNTVCLPNWAVEGRAVCWRIQTGKNGNDSDAVGHDQVDERGAEPERNSANGSEDDILH